MVSIFRFGTFLENGLEPDILNASLDKQSLETTEGHDKNRGNRIHASREKVPWGSRKMTTHLT